MTDKKRKVYIVFSQSLYSMHPSDDFKTAFTPVSVSDSGFKMFFELEEAEKYSRDSEINTEVITAYLRTESTGD